MSDDTDEQWADDLGFDEKPVAKGGKRLGVQWCPWMGDWFTSWSPRNGNNNAEGEWDQWVDLALQILADPMTKLVRPNVHMPDAPIRRFYSEVDRELTATELRTRFDPEASR